MKTKFDKVAYMDRLRKELEECYSLSLGGMNLDEIESEYQNKVGVGMWLIRNEFNYFG